MTKAKDDNKKASKKEAVEARPDTSFGTDPQSGRVRLDPAQVRNEWNKLFNDVENLIQKVRGVVGVHEDADKLVKHLNAARDEVANVLGLEKLEDGTYTVNGGSAAGPGTVGVTTSPDA